MTNSTNTAIPNLRKSLLLSLLHFEKQICDCEDLPSLEQLQSQGIEDIGDLPLVEDRELIYHPLRRKYNHLLARFEKHEFEQITIVQAFGLLRKALNKL